MRHGIIVVALLAALQASAAPVHDPPGDRLRPAPPPPPPRLPLDVATDITTDGSFGGIETTIDPDADHVYVIPEDLARRIGANLFHSFLTFNLGSGDTALFTATEPTSNVICRITGGSASQIFGKIASNIAGANLFLVNSAGILFGEGASLDVQGSFHASTADVLRFGNGETFAARPIIGETLSAAAPASFGFLSQGPAAITVSHATLAVPDGLDLELTAGNVTLDASTLRALDGHVTVTAVNDLDVTGGFVFARDVDLTAKTMDLDGAFVEASGLDGPHALHVTGEQITLTGGTTVRSTGDGGSVRFETPDDASGPTRLVIRGGSVVSANVAGDGVGGGVTVRGFDLLHMLEDSQLQSEIESGGTAGNILVEVGEVKLENRSEISTQALDGLAVGGSITIHADRLELRSGGSVESIAIVAAGAGDIVITADSILVEGAYIGGVRSQPSSITSTSGASAVAGASAGDITITAGEIQLLNGGRIAAETLAGGAGGNVTITADRVVVAGFNDELAAVLASGLDLPLGEVGSLFLNIRRDESYARSAISAGSVDPGDPTVPGTFGDAGAVHVTADELLVSDRGAVTTSSSTDHAAGSIRIDVAKLTLESGADVSSANTADGAAGSVTIDAGALVARDASIRTTAAGGPGGSITLTGGSVSLARSEISSSQTAPSPGGEAHAGGDVAIDVSSLTLSDGSSIRAESVADGNAGSIAVHSSGDLSILESAITTEAAQSFGGNVDLRAGGTLYFRDGRAETSVATGAGSGGNVNLAGTYVVLDGSEVRANADAGNGGNITIDAGTYVASVDSVVDASSNTGISGAVVVNSPEVNVASGLVQLPAEFLGASKLLRPSCAARNTGAREGSFVVQRHKVAPEAIEPTSEAIAQFVRPGALDAVPTRGIRIVGDETARPIAAATTTPTAAVETVSQAHARFSKAVTEAQAVRDDRSLSFALGNLAALYEDAGRADEALYLTRRALAAAERADAPDALYRALGREGRLLRARGDRDGAIASLRRAVDVLEEIRIGAQGAYAPVYLDLVGALLDDGSVDHLKEARGTVERLKAAELRDYFQDDCVAELEAKTAQLDDLATGAAIVYPILLPDRLELLVTLPSGLHRYTSPVGSAALAGTAARFRDALQDPGRDRWREDARSLYDALLAPYASDLEREGVDTLVFVPDGPLRTIPMAALHDGTRFLGERYALAVTPSLALTDPEPLGREGLEILLAGVSDAVDGFPALPGVPAELRAIQAMRGGRVLLDDAFDVERVEEAISTSEPSIVHIASHAVFTGEPATSFVLTHDGKLTMERLSEMVSVTRFRRRPLEMLVLSACETAAGNDRAGLGLAGVAIRAGARSAVGSLWSIADEAATRVMESFYQELAKSGVSRAEALRRAQAKLRADERLAHPYYWSPFVVINNWR
jgi:filamentous hemagglutinin family protein